MVMSKSLTPLLLVLDSVEYTNSGAYDRKDTRRNWSILRLTTEGYGTGTASLEHVWTLPFLTMSSQTQNSGAPGRGPKGSQVQLSCEHTFVSSPRSGICARTHTSALGSQLRYGTRKKAKWLVTAANGRHFRAKYFLLNTGFAAKRYIPDWKGIDRFQGTWVHPSYWPKTGPDLTGKKVAVIGTGSTGVQLSQQLSQVAGEFVLFQRTPNLALPMRQIEYAADEQAFPRENYTKFFTDRTQGFGGILINFLPRATFDDTPEQRQATYQKLWDEGDFHFWLGTYHDMMFSWDANKEAYTFWRDKVRARINDPKLKEMLAPEIQPHAFGCKRISLEIGFYEIFNQPNVSLVDVNATPVLEVTEKGLKTTEKLWEFDYVICATGFDAVTGGFNEIDIRGTSGQKLTDKWLEGVRTYLGLAVSQFPNMFFTYGPQAPTAFCNGPTCAELQGEWIVNVLNHMREKGSKSIDAEEQAESEWTKGVTAIANASLLPTAKSVSHAPLLLFLFPVLTLPQWYMADNIPGKVRQPLIYLGGVPTYYKTINDCAKNGYAGFNLK